MADSSSPPFPSLKEGAVVFERMRKLQMRVVVWSEGKRARGQLSSWAKRAAEQKGMRAGRRAAEQLGEKSG